MLDLSYGENPHQRAAYYAQVGARMHVLSMVRQLGGKELSFNNMLDLNAGRQLVDEFELPACVIIKHNNPCGCAVGATAREAYERAFACDPMMMAPSWFWMKNRTLSDFRAGSRRLARFQSSEPPTARAPMTTSRTISSTRLTGS